MSIRWTVWPLLASLLVQAIVIGGAPGAVVVLCLGGEHHEEHHDQPGTAVVEGDCTSGCGHHRELPVPSIQTPHVQDCSCVDVEIPALDLRFRSGDADDQTPMPMLLMPTCLGMSDVFVDARAPRRAPAAAPPPRSALAVLRTIRILT